MAEKDCLRIYLASSWKNQSSLIRIQEALKVSYKYEVDLFCNTQDKNRFCFSFADLPEPILVLDNKSVRKYKEVDQAFLEDKKWLDWCDVCILVLPAGKSAHLEAGYAKGCNKKLIIYDPNGFEFGDVDVMYGFADLITESWVELVQYLRNIVNT